MNEMQTPPPPSMEPPPKQPFSRLEMLRAKWKGCKDPYWKSWLESAIRFALWQKTGLRSTWDPATEEGGAADAGIIDA